MLLLFLIEKTCCKFYFILVEIKSFYFILVEIEFRVVYFLKNIKKVDIIRGLVIEI